MSHHFTQSHDDGVAAFYWPLVGAAVATMILALLLKVLFGCCCSCIRQVKRCFSSFLTSHASKMEPSEIEKTLKYNIRNKSLLEEALTHGSYPGSAPYRQVKRCSSSFLTSHASKMEPSEIEKTLKYNFRNKSLLEEALTHGSYPGSAPYKRLEFVGDAALGLALSNHVYWAYPEVDSGQLSSIKAANFNNEKFARVAVKHNLFQYVRHNDPTLREKVEKFVEVVSQEDNTVWYGGSMKAPKVLADIVESVAAAVYVDIDFDLIKLWKIFRVLLKPIVTLKDLQQQGQPVTVLFEFCQKQGKHVEIKPWKKGLKSIASVYVDGKFVASDSSDQKKTARLNAAKIAFHKLSESLSAGVNALGIDGPFEIEGAEQRLRNICCDKKWPEPILLEKEEGLQHDKRFISSVLIPNEELYITGDRKYTEEDSRNSAASFMIRALQESDYT